MKKNRKTGWLILVALLAVTFGARAFYKVRAPLFAPAEATVATEPRPGLLALTPWKAPAIGPLEKPQKLELGRGGVQLSAALDRSAVLQRGTGVVQVELRVKTDAADGAVKRMPTDFVVIVDRSGSMSGEKLEYAKQALIQLIGRLRPEDRFGLVTYENDAEVRLALSHASADARDRWLDEVRKLETAGGTNLSAGLDAGLDMLENARQPSRAGRVLLLSDGLANQGDSSLSGLTRRARRAVGGEYVLSTIGIGSDFDENVMTSLASAGAGAFYYLAKLEVLPSFLDAELKTASETYARSAEIRFRPGPGVKVTNVSGATFEAQGDEVVIPLGSLYAAHERKLWMTLKLPTTDLRDNDPGQIALRYRSGTQLLEVPGSALPKVATVADTGAFRSRIERDVWERAVLEDELTRVQDELGDAIRTGKEADVDHALASISEARELSRALGSQRAQEGIARLDQDAASAKQAQAAPAETRNLAAKRQKAIGFIGRNSGSYRDSNPMSAF